MVDEQSPSDSPIKLATPHFLVGGKTCPKLENDPQCSPTQPPPSVPDYQYLPGPNRAARLLRTLLPPFGAFLGIIFLSLLNSKHVLHQIGLGPLSEHQITFLIGSFGAQAVLVFAAPQAPLAQPWNCVVGNTVSAFMGVSVRKVFLDQGTWGSGVLIPADSVYTPLPEALAVALAILAMILLDALHPPGGATALIACVLGPSKLRDSGYLFVLCPVFVGSLIFVAMAWGVGWIGAKTEGFWTRSGVGPDGKRRSRDHSMEETSGLLESGDRVVSEGENGRGDRDMEDDGTGLSLTGGQTQQGFTGAQKPPPSVFVYPAKQGWRGWFGLLGKVW